MPAADRISRTRGIASEEPACTSSRRSISLSICLLSSFSFPAPKMIRFAVANSKENIVLLVSICREDVGEFDSLPRFCHHLHDVITPALVMRRFFMCGGCLGCFIDLDQDESRGVIGLLNDVKG